MLPHASLALHVLVRPSLDVETTSMMGEPLQLSVALGWSNCTGALQSIVLFALQVIVGGVTSSVQIAVRNAVAILPQESVAVNVLV